MQHTIRINQTSAGKYSVTGAVSIPTTSTPIPDAALALKAAGTGDSDSIVATCGDVTFIPMTLGRLTAPRPAPPRFNPALEVWTSR